MSHGRLRIPRWQCLWHGHDFDRVDAYGEVLADGRVEELYYCRRCGVGIWRPGKLHAGSFPEPETAHQLPDMVAPMAPPGSRQHISP
ncbi:MAG TPA: hypothetical protein VHY20_03985 [Pirellulales bacterium]|jgi:hypothetical protein|nr:hypothetical protein [Pirellulales bacterium]